MVWMSFPVIWPVSRPNMREILFWAKCYFWASFPVKRPVSCPKILQLTIGRVFQVNGLAHDPSLKKTE